jgi:hypothetical protein
VNSIGKFHVCCRCGRNKPPESSLSYQLACFPSSRLRGDPAGKAVDQADSSLTLGSRTLKIADAAAVQSGICFCFEKPAFWGASTLPCQYLAPAHLNSLD